MMRCRRTMEIKRLEASDNSRWDAFVAACPEATFFHKAGWVEVLRRAAGHSSHYLYAESQGEIQGVLPLAQVKSRLFGNALISTPFCVYGGIAAVSETARTALAGAARDLAWELGVDHLELRNVGPTEAGRPGKDIYVTFQKPLAADDERNLLAIPRKQRAAVRKSMAAGLHSVIDPTADRLFEVYAESVRNLGTPVFPKILFRALLEEFGEECEVLTVEHRGRPVSSVLSFYFRDQVLPYYGGGTRAARTLGANHYLYWELMRRAVHRRARRFDFGRSKRGTGSYHFKACWGFEPSPLHYRYELVKADAVPDLNPLNPKYRLFIAAWKRLPLPLSKLIGPWLSRNLG